MLCHEKNERKLLTRHQRFGKLPSDMSKTTKPKPAINVLISRITAPEKELAAEIDRVAERFHQPVKSIGMMAIKIGLPEVEKGFQQMLEKQPA